MSWSHSRQEAREVYECLLEAKMCMLDVLSEARLLKLFFAIDDEMEP